MSSHVPGLFQGKGASPVEPESDENETVNATDPKSNQISMTKRPQSHNIELLLGDQPTENLIPLDLDMHTFSKNTVLIT